MESLKTLREARDKTQEWVAAKLKVHPSSISQYEHGTTRPRTEHLESYAKALKVSTKRLLAAIGAAQRQGKERTRLRDESKEIQSGAPQELHEERPSR